jgi:hypothetical protein
MKRFLLISIIFFFTVANAQINTETKKDVKNETGAKTVAGIPGGYENISWGVRLSEALDKIKGKLVFTDEKSIIISKDGDLEYHYGFFYIDPALQISAAGKGPEKKTEVQPEKKESGTAGAEKADEGTFFYVALKFPYLSMEEVKKKIEEKYGPNTNENLHKMQGALAWNGENTIIIMWVDRYENRAFCRRITYVDKRITKELGDYQFKAFNRVELAILRQLDLAGGK